MRMLHAALACAVGCLASCSPDAAPNPPNVPPGDRSTSAPDSHFQFVDVTQERGLAGFRQENGDAEKPTVLESIGGGVAFLDYDRDGWLDAYLTNGGHLGLSEGDERPKDALYRNDAGDFRDVTEALGLGDEGWTCGVRAADVTGDGWCDLYLTNWGANVFLVNQGGERFEDRTSAAGVGDARWSTGAAYVDADRDGDLDLYVANYVVFDEAHLPPEGQEYRGVTVYYGPRGMQGERDTYYENRGDGTFVDSTEKVGVSESLGFGFQVVAFDYDDDGHVDLYVGNDSTPNYLWQNDGTGRFVDRGFGAGAALSKEGMQQAGMGVAVGDADGDGRLDVYVTNFSEDYYTLYRNDGAGFFSDATVRFGLARDTVSVLGWGCGFGDFDLDGDLDLYAVNGHVYPQVDRFELGTRYRQRNQLFENTERGRFALVSAGPGFELEEASRGSALGDFDNDGDLDILIGNLDGRPTLLENRSERRGSWLRVVLDPGLSAPAPAGAVVHVMAGEARWKVAVQESSSFLSTNDARVLVGLGERTSFDALSVRWPDGVVQEVPGGAVDREVVVRRSGGD